MLTSSVTHCFSLLFSVFPHLTYLMVYFSFFFCSLHLLFLAVHQTRAAMLEQQVPGHKRHQERGGKTNIGKQAIRSASKTHLTTTKYEYRSTTFLHSYTGRTPKHKLCHYLKREPCKSNPHGELHRQT